MSEAWIVGNQTAVGEFFDVPLSTIQWWSKSGMPGKKGRYNLRDISRWLVTKKTLEPSDGDEETREQAELRLKRAMADERELKNAERRGELISYELVGQFLPRMAMLLRGLGERLETHFGRECLVMYNEHIDAVGESTEAFISDLCELRNGDENGEVEHSAGIRTKGES